MSDMSCFRTAPQAEKKAAKELRRLGIKAYVPRQKEEVRVSKHTKRRIIKYRITASGYVCAKHSHYLANYVRGRVGGVSTTDLHRMYRTRKIEAQHQRPQIGATVSFEAGGRTLSGVIKDDRKRYLVITEKASGRDMDVRYHRLLRPPA